jgi:hypothetical protein
MRTGTRLGQRSWLRGSAVGGLAGLGLAAALLASAPGASADPAAHGTGSVHAQGAWYAVPRTGGGNPGKVTLRAGASTGSAAVGSVKAPKGAWCWHQETNCGDYVNGGSYRRYAGAPKYRDWLPVAASNGKRVYVARHCVIATYK